MNQPHSFISLLFCLFLFACNQEQPVKVTNPPAPTFNLESSDAKAIDIADEVMKASGGRENWDNTRYLSWVFAGGRKHFWDKQTGDIRIESNRDSTTYLMNVKTMKGKVKIKDQELTESDSLGLYLKKGNSIWINDSYWLVMPFKMKDDGVTLKYLGDGKTQDGRMADNIEMTFKAVGDTPRNKYHVMVDKESRLITEWAFFREAEQDSSNFIMPWRDYQTYGNLKISSDRDRLQLTEISVDGAMPENVFTEF